MKSRLMQIASLLFTTTLISAAVTGCYLAANSPQNDGLFFAVLLNFVLLFLVIFSSLKYLNIKNKREQLKNQISTLDAIYKNLPDMVFSKDINGRYTSCNNSYARFMNLDVSQIIGKTVLDIYTRDFEKALRIIDEDREFMSGTSAVIEENWLVRPDNTRGLYETHKTPLIMDDKVVGMLGIVRDITEHKEAEEAAREASRIKSSFLAKISHEIRTPMNAIIGMAELALRENELSAAHKHTLTVKQAGTHLLSLINDLLDFSKIETGKMEIIPHEYSFSSLINDVVSIIRMRIVDTQIRFAVNVDSKIPNALIGDETRLRQVLLNILTNAVKYTEKGFVSFTVDGNIDNNSTDRVVNFTMEVKDTGKGIKPEDVKKLFSEYVQIDKEENIGIEGVGLGLAITWNIIKAMGGDIKVKSEYGKGSTFTVEVPQGFSSPNALAVIENIEEKNVLVYERRELYADSIVRSIKNLYVTCTLVSNDEELTEKMTASPYSFIFISYFLFERNKKTITSLGRESRVVILMEFGEMLPDKKLTSIAMPVYCMSLANILNSTTDSFFYSENEESIVRFIAPEAKVLIVDDITTNLKVAEGLMLPYNMQIDLCKSGREAIEAIGFKHYDLVFMDHKMPEMNGVETTEYLRKMGEEESEQPENQQLHDKSYYKNLPIVALTANAIAGTREYFLQNGFDDFISKPIDTVKLSHILERWLPKEKQISNTADIGRPVMMEMLKVDSDIQIDGIDVNRGLFLSGGSFDSYLEIITFFYKDGFEKIRELKACIKARNLNLYTIQVHALKSAAANIGAVELSEMAYTLEMAGERKDWDYIDTNNPALLTALEIVLGNIINTLTLQKKDSAKVDGSFDVELVKTRLSELKKAIENLEAGLINRLSEELQKLAQASDVVSSLFMIVSDQILVGDYDEAIESIDKLLLEFE